MLVSAFEIAEDFRLFWLMEISKNFISCICYCTVFEEDSLIVTLLLALLISMLASRVFWKNVFLWNVEIYIVKCAGYSLFCRLRLSSQIAQLSLGSVGRFQRIYVLSSEHACRYQSRNRSSG
jgi:hypothetical protein